MARITDASVAETIETVTSTIRPQLVMGSQITQRLVFSTGSGSKQAFENLTGTTLLGRINEIDTAAGTEPVAGYDLTTNGETWELTVANGLLAEVDLANGVIAFTIPSELGAATATHAGRTGAPSDSPKPGLPKYYEIGIQISRPGTGTNRQIFQIVGIISLMHSVV